MRHSILWFAFTLLLSSPVQGQAAAGADDAGLRRREQELRIADIVQAMALPPGARVADIGAGEGEYEAALSRAVGPRGRVYAEDISENALKRLREKIAKQELGNVEVIAGVADDPKLPDQLDAALIVIAYHEFADPRKLVDRVAGALRPGGRLVIVEMAPHRTLSRPRADQVKNHVIAPDLVEAEIREAGFEIVSRDDHFIDRPDEESARWMIVFRKPRGTGTISGRL